MKRITILLTIFLAFLLLISSSVIAEDNSTKILVCSNAFEALGKIGEPKARDLLIRGLKSRESFIRWHAAEALGKLSGKEALSLLSENKEFKEQTIHLLSRLRDKETIPLLRKMLNDENYLVSILSAKALLELGQIDAEKVLLDFLNNNSPEIRATAVEQLGDFQDKYLPQLIELLSEDKNHVVRQKVIEQLGRNKYRPATELIEKALNDEYPSIRQAACSAISQIEGVNAISLLKERISDNDITVRTSAKVELAMLGEQSIVNLCWKDLEGAEPLLKTSSYIALAYLKDINILPVLIKAVVAKENPIMVKSEAARALVTLKPFVSEVVNKAIAKSKTANLQFDDLDINYRSGGRSLTLIFSEALKDENNPLHQDAPLILGQLQDSMSLPVLREALFQKDPNIVASVAMVLGNMQDKEAVDALIRVCEQYGF